MKDLVDGLQYLLDYEGNVQEDFGLTFEVCSMPFLFLFFLFFHINQGLFCFSLGFNVSI